MQIQPPTIVTAVGLEGDRDPPPPVEREMLDGTSHLDLEGSLEDDMHFAITRLLGEDGVSKGINDCLPGAQVSQS